MKFKPEFNNYRESPWILITLPESRRMDHLNVNNGVNNINTEHRKNRMSFGIHHLVAKNNALNSATWPRPKMKKSKSRCASNEDDDRPKTATLDHPKVLDIAFLGKIDMTSLSKKSLMSIANLCILPVKQEAKRNGCSLNGGRGAKTRRYTPNNSLSPHVKKAIRFLASEKETNSENEDARSQIIPSPSKTLKSKKIPVKIRSCASSDKSVDSDKEVKRSTSLKNVDELFGPVACLTCGRSDQPERLHSHPLVPRSILKTVEVVTPRVEIVKSSVRKPMPMRYRSEVRQREEVATVKTPEKKTKETVSRIPETKRKERIPEPESRKKEAVERNLDTEIMRKDLLARTPEPEIKRKDILSRTPEPEIKRKEIQSRTPEPEIKRKDIQSKTPEPDIKRKDILRRTPEPDIKRKDMLSRTPEPEVRRKDSLVRTPEPRVRKKEDVVSRTPEPAAKKKEDGEEMQQKESVARQGPRTVTCYICGRSFGTASHPLHEPRCLARWYRENALLAPHLQTSPPRKPISQVTNREEWNQLAYEASQSQLVSCEHCDRTFNPDRLEVHQRSCRPGVKRFNKAQSQDESTSSESEDASAGSGGGGGGGGRVVGPPPVVYCYICGRMFGSKSIGIHEPKCMDKWHLENDQLPSHQRRLEPSKPEPGKLRQHNRATIALNPAPSAPTRPPDTAPTPAPALAETPSPNMSRAQRTKKPPTQSVKPTTQSVKPTAQSEEPTAQFPAPLENPPTQMELKKRPPALKTARRPGLCYLCGRMFGTSSINIHEKQCLKKWRLENDKLPQGRRRPEPEKPDIIYNVNGGIDFQGTMDAIWETHLTQLVPCKHCARTFNPDRVDIHERACKGPTH